MLLVTIIPSTVGCGGGDGTSSSQTITATVGSSGGHVDLNTDDGVVTINFPEGVVDSDTIVEINEKELVTSLPQGLDLAGAYVYDITCSSTSLSDEIVISLPIPGEIDSALMYAIMRLDADSWIYIGGSIDRSSNSIIAPVDHLSDYAVVSAPRDVGSFEIGSYDSSKCANATPTFEFQSKNKEAYVFSVPCPVGDERLGDAITSEACSTVLSYALGGSLVPGIGTIVGAALGAIKVISEKYDPVRIALLTKYIEVVDGQIQGEGLLSDPNHASAVLFLDFVGTYADLDHVQRYHDGLWVHVQHSLTSYHESRQLLTEEEMTTLDPSKSYIVFPRRPFNVTPLRESYPVVVDLIAKALYKSTIPGCYGRDEQRVRFTLEPIVSSQSVSFPDPNLEAVVREAIGMPTGTIRTAHLQGLTRIQAHEADIANLGGLEHCHDLTSIDLFGNQITDLSPLSGLTNLEEMFLVDNSITDISPLARLTNLSSLSLQLSSISDISPLSNLTNLTSLVLGSNEISDISPLANLTKMTRLNIDRNHIVDISPLSNCTDLTELDLSLNNITDISPLSNLTRLRHLQLYSNDITNISALSNLTNLTRLFLMGNDLTDISPISNLTNLTKIDLDITRITDIQPLVENSGLSAGDEVSLRSLQLNDRSINVYIPQLEERGIIVQR